MKSLTTLFLFLSILSLSAQDINPQLYQKTWLDNEVRYFNGYAITKIFGQMPHAPAAYQFMPITAIAYRGFIGLKDSLLAEAQLNNWKDEELNRKLEELEKNAQGGELEIYISRYDEEQANFRWFFVILRGMDDKGKLWEKELGYQAPQRPYERGWWNYTTLQIPIDVKPPFYVYFNDKSSKYLSDFKFKVEQAPPSSATE